MRRLSATSRRVLTLALAVTTLAGCTVGPNYQKPAPPTPSTGRFASTLPPAVGSADQPPPKWWRLYDSPAIDQLVQQALTHNNTLLEAAANLAEARAALSLAKAGRFPSTALAAGAQYGVTSPQLAAANAAGSGPPSPIALLSSGLDASYEVDLFGRVRRAVEAARADVDAQRAAEDAVRISVAGETTRAYLNACAYAHEVAVARQSLEAITQSYTLTLAQARFGVASDFDVARARQLVDETRATLPTYENQRRASLFELAVLTGRPPEEISHEADACQAPPKLTTVLPIGDVGSLFRRRPDVREAERRLAANVARIGLATADLYPTISIGGAVQTAASSLSGLGSLSNVSYAIGPLLSWSFPNTLVAQAQIREARANASATFASFQGTVLQALQDTEEAVSSYGAELQRNAALVSARDQSQIAFKLAQVQFGNGAASYIDVLTAEANLVQAAAALASSDQAVASDQVTLFKALGGGWEQAPNIHPLAITDAKTNKPIEVR